MEEKEEKGQLTQEEVAAALNATTEEEAEGKTEAEPQVETQQRRNDSVPLAKYLSIEKELKQIKREREREKLEAIMEREKAKVAQDYIKRNYPEEEAVKLAERDITIQREFEEARRERREAQVERLARSGDFFADAETYMDEVVDMMKRSDLTAKQAYMAIRGDIRTNEMQTQGEQRNLAARAKATDKKTATATATAPDSDYSGLDNDDKKALAKLQELQPEMNWSAAKYKKVMKR